MAQQLAGKKVAILATEGFEQVELTEPKKALEAAGATTHIISLKPGEIKGWNLTDWGESVKVDKTVAEAKTADYDMLLLPGGVQNPDKLRLDPAAVAFAKSFVDSGKLVGAICHAAWTLIEAGVVKGKTMTSWPSLKTDLKNAGATWVDQETVVDGKLITSRKPDDIPAFNQKLIAALQGETAKAA